MRSLMLILAVFVLTISTAYATAPAVVAWSDNFNSYNNGALNNQGGWDNSVPNTDIAVVDGTVQVSGGTGGVSVKNLFSSAYAADMIWFHTQVKGTAAGPGTLWGVYVDDTSGKNMARIYGRSDTVRGRIGGTGYVTSQPSLSCGDVWDDIDIKIDTVNKISEYFMNGVSIGTTNWGSTGANSGANGTVGAIWIERVGSSQSVWLDNMALGTVPEPSSLIALSMFGFGALGMIKRRK